MCAKETKLILKEVREAIKCEKYKEAIEKSQSLLKNEPKNYMAYLLLGAAYQNNNKAEAAKHLRKALEFSPGPPTVALQGLANCAPTEELSKIYSQLLDLVPEKYLDYYEKLLLVSKNTTVARDCFNILKDQAIRNSDERKRNALKYLANIWMANDFEVAEDESELYKTTLEALIEEPPSEHRLTAYKRYLKLLFKQKDYASCIKHACIMVTQYEDDIYAYEWICKIYCEKHNASDNETWPLELKAPIQTYAEKLLQLNENSSLGLLVKAMDMYALQQYVDARGILQRVQQIYPNYPVSDELLARTEMHIGAYGIAAILWKKLGQETNDYAQCLSHEIENEPLQEAVLILENLPRTEQNMRALARCYFNLGEQNKLADLELDGLTKAEYLMTPTEAIEYLKSNSEMEGYDALLLSGKLYLQLANYSEAISCLLKATRLQPYRAECFYNLGTLYAAINDDLRARKCFEKCVNLNPMCEQAVNKLSGIYQKLQENDLNEALLRNTLRHMTTHSAKRIQYKLGLHYLQIKKWDDAIQFFRNAIKHDVDCMMYWESLGDAYASRGSYNSALRVFQKINEMLPSNIYARLQIALIKTILRMYAEAIDDFEAILKTHPDYLPCLKGAAEAHIGLANNLKQEYRYVRAKSHLQFAVNYLQRIFLNGAYNEMVWLWRLTANVFVQTAQMPTSLANLEVSGKLSKREEDASYLTRKDMLLLAMRFYTRALQLKENTYLWYELSVCCYYTAKYIPDEALTHLELAKKTCKMAINEHSTRWQNWNLLGVIYLHKAINNLPLAQHCFIQALQLDRKSYTTWTNLGVLYLKLAEIKLANQAFQRAQQSSPIYPNAWIGQAMIAETIHEEEEAMDLFRHCQQFEYHPESALGYAHWVCYILSIDEKRNNPHYKHAIERMHADVVALDAINWYVINEEEQASISSLTFKAFLNIRQKLYQPALSAYMQAIDIATPGADRDKIYTNLGYLLMKLNEPEKAINAFNMVAQATFKPIIGLALAYYRAGQHQESYSVYNSVLKSVAGTDDNKAARILVAMASMVYAFQGEADTKTLLYQCILLRDSPIQALYSACALGILHSDTQLTTTILMELKNYENNMDYCAHIAFLTAQYYVTNREPRKGLNYLLSRIHTFPHCPELRKILANYLLDNYTHMKQYRIATSQISLSAIELGHRNKSKICDAIEDAKTLLTASRALSAVDKRSSLILIQRAVHLYPQNQDAWQLLGV